MTQDNGGTRDQLLRDLAPEMAAALFQIEKLLASEYTLNFSTMSSLNIVRDMLAKLTPPTDSPVDEHPNTGDQP